MATINEIRAQKCENCRFGEWYEGVDEGYCVRYPPTPAGDRERGVDSHWPRVSTDDWCGEWKNKELEP